MDSKGAQRDSVFFERLGRQHARLDGATPDAASASITTCHRSDRHSNPGRNSTYQSGTFVQKNETRSVRSIIEDELPKDSHMEFVLID